MVQIEGTATSDDQMEGGGRKPLPGIYHALVQKADESCQKGHWVWMEFEILAGTTGSSAECPLGTQVGTVLGEKFNLSGQTPEKTASAHNRLRRLGRVLGLLSEEELKNPVLNVAFDPGAAGRQCIIQVKPHSYKNREGQDVNTVQIEFYGFWSLTDPKAPKCPRNPEYLALLPPDQAGPPPAASNPGAPINPPSGGDQYDTALAGL